MYFHACVERVTYVVFSSLIPKALFLEDKENTHSFSSLDVFDAVFLRNFLFPIQIRLLNVSSVSGFKDINNLSLWKNGEYAWHSENDF